MHAYIEQTPTAEQENGCKSSQLNLKRLDRVVKCVDSVSIMVLKSKRGLITQSIDYPSSSFSRENKARNLI